jgi:ATP-binding cassette subfamily F protein 3
MLHINDLSYRIEGRPLFEHATAGIPEGHKVGLVGRNGTGKTTLLRLIAGEIAPDDGSIGYPKHARLAHVSHKAPGQSTDSLYGFDLLFRIIGSSAAIAAQ